MRDLSESNVISIGFSSAPGKSVCRFLLLPQPSVVVCGSPRHALSSRITIPPKYRSQKWGISAPGDTCLTLLFPKQEKIGQAQSLLVQELGRHLLLARALPPETLAPLGTRLGRVWCPLRGVPSPRGGTEPFEGAAVPSQPLPSGKKASFWIGSMAGGLFPGGGARESERGPSAGSSLRPYLTFRQLSLSLSKGHG